MKTARHGQDVIIVGAGANEQTAWAIAKQLSARSHGPVNVFHPHDGDYHRVSCYDGEPMGHVYNAGGFWFACAPTRGTTIRAKAEALRNGGRARTEAY